MTREEETADLALWAAKAIEGVLEQIEENDPVALEQALDMIREEYGDAIRSWASKAKQAQSPD